MRLASPLHDSHNYQCIWTVLEDIPGGPGLMLGGEVLYHGVTALTAPLLLTTGHGRELQRGSSATLNKPTID